MRILKEENDIVKKIRKLEEYLDEIGLSIIREYNGLSIYDIETGINYRYLDAEDIYEYPEEFPYTLETKIGISE